MRTLLALCLLTVVCLGQETARIESQEIDLRIDPESGTFHAVVRAVLAGEPDLSDLEKRGVTIERKGDTFVLSAKVEHAVQKSAAPTWVAGDSTPGTIGTKGTYLTHGFYLPVQGTCRFKVSIEVPLPHRAVSQGRRVSESEKDGVYRVSYEGTAPSGGLVVVTGPWVVDEAEIDGLSCRTYLFEQDRAHAPLLLSTLRAEVPRYQKVFGGVPDGRFDVVENFFATGYGFSNFTLLGDTVIRYVCAKTARQGLSILPSGYLDHELVHCWLGNHLMVDYERGNWCEALTTYFTNYGSSVREGRDVAYRKKVSRSFSLRVGPENDYPLREFKAKSHAFENDIGYGKGSMVFHMLAREMGREAFEAAVRKLVETRGGEALGWDDVAEALGSKAWFEPWLTRKGGPVLELGVLKVAGNRITGTIRQAQDGPAYPLLIPVRVTTADGVEEFGIRSSSKESPFRITVKSAPTRVELDPDHHVFRRVPRDAVAPSLQGVLTASKRVGFGDDKLLARMKVESVEPALPTDAAVLAIGLPETLRDDILKRARRQDGSLKIEEGRFEFRGESYDQEGDGILFSFARPDAPGLPVAFFHGNAPAAFARTSYLPYYQSESWVVFRNGRPIARGAFPGDRATRGDITPAREGEPETLLRTLLDLTDDARKGRQAGTTEAYKLANELRGRLHVAGLKVLPWPAVSIPTGAVEGAPPYYPFHLSASPTGPVTYERVVRHPTEDPKGNLVLVPEDGAHDLARAYADSGAAAVAVIASEKWPLAREAAFQGALPPPVKKRIDGRNEAVAVSGMLIRSAVTTPLKIPYLYMAEGTDLGGRIDFKLRRGFVATTNIVGLLGEGRERPVLVSAHWDGVGTIDGQVAPGASDNAAGVAVVLWVAEQLARDHKAGRLKRPVLVVLFGGEEMGLAGSRQFVQAMRNPKTPFGKPLCAINVDGVGSRTDNEVFVIGRSHHPQLLEAFQKSMDGLELGRDIDRFAFKEGSDHWPLHEAGIPAVSIFAADYRAMNTLRDKTERVDMATLRRIANTVYRTVRDLASR